MLSAKGQRKEERCLGVESVDGVRVNLKTGVLESSSGLF